jgi:hypothetical protein
VELVTVQRVLDGCCASLRTHNRDGLRAPDGRGECRLTLRDSYSPVPVRDAELDGGGCVFIAKIRVLILGHDLLDGDI